jgi:FdhD protein
MGMDNKLYETVQSFHYTGDEILPTWSELLVEIRLEIIVNNARPIIIMFTPGMTRELVFGFMFTEGMIERMSDVEESFISPVRKEGAEQVIEARVKIADPYPGFPGRSGKGLIRSSSGFCGDRNVYDSKDGFARVTSKKRFSMEVLEKLPAKLIEFQPLYQKTGGAHAAILFDHEGNSVLYSEDIGRHNALDKVVGSALIKGSSCDDKILVSSGRASFEMIVKTARAGFPVFVAMSRPTSRAVEAAKVFNITLLDMAKGSNRIYTHVSRIKGLKA